MGQINHIFRKVLTRWLGDSDGLVVVPVMSGPAKGLRFQWDLLGGESNVLGKDNWDDITQLSEVIKPGWRVWDFGTEAGTQAVLLSSWVGPTGGVTTFGATGELLRAQRNALINQCTNIQFVPLDQLAEWMENEPPPDLVRIGNVENHIMKLIETVLAKWAPLVWSQQQRDYSFQNYQQTRLQHLGVLFTPYPPAPTKVEA